MAESVATYRQRRDGMLAQVNAIPGLGSRSPAGAFYRYVRCEGMIGRTTPDGRALARDSDVVMYLLDSVGAADAAILAALRELPLAALSDNMHCNTPGPSWL